MAVCGFFGEDVMKSIEVGAVVVSGFVYVFVGSFGCGCGFFVKKF